MTKYETPDHDYALRVALDTIQEMRQDIASVHRNLYQAECNLTEQTRLTQQARGWAMELETELHALKETLGVTDATPV